MSDRRGDDGPVLRGRFFVEAVVAHWVRYAHGLSACGLAVAPTFPIAAGKTSHVDESGVGWTHYGRDATCEECRAHYAADRLASEQIR